MESLHSALDPELENSVDIQTLLNNSCEVTDETWEKLILDIKTSEMEKMHNNAPDFCGINVISKTTAVTEGRVDDFSGLTDLDFIANNEQISSCLGAVRETLHANLEDADMCRNDFRDVDMESSFSSSSTSDDSSNEQSLSPPPITPSSTYIVTPPPSPNEVQLHIRPRGRPGRKPLSPNGPIKKKKQPPKGTAEYYDKRARNNLAIKKCREKAKQKQIETEARLLTLENENTELKLKNDKLGKKLEVLKTFLMRNNPSMPDNIAKVLMS
ncbi:hypothetical protein FSP39_009110 [Pinctada imbricata]|uniref:BZIP domain-containing protein n=2 Tax=Pinctada TaxID=50425 RepID=A0AA88XMX4_PINIB|nr:C/EBP-B [Pinctada fucata]KAK3085818.1 hypothetical protein FSP39_009110 [Pinctada imbricata]